MPTAEYYEYCTRDRNGRQLSPTASHQERKKRILNMHTYTYVYVQYMRDKSAERQLSAYIPIAINYSSLNYPRMLLLLFQICMCAFSCMCVCRVQLVLKLSILCVLERASTQSGEHCKSTMLVCEHRGEFQLLM